MIEEDREEKQMKEFSQITQEEIQKYKDTMMKMHQLISNLSQSTPFKIQNPHLQTAFGILQSWRNRRNYGEDKKLKLQIELSGEHKNKTQFIVKIFSQSPSVQLTINGVLYPAEGIVKSKGLMYYEGTKDKMIIYEQSSLNTYIGTVDDLDSLKPHGKGFYQANLGPKNSYSYQGEYKFGKKEGFGILRQRLSIYQGQWLNDQKHGYGCQHIWKKKKKNREAKQQIENQQSVKDEKQQSIISEKDISSKSDVSKQVQKQQIKEEKQIKQEEIKIKKGHPKEKQSNKILFSKYEGNFTEGYRNGHGKQESRSGVYDGQWMEGAKNGEGKMKFKSGAIYKGQWKNNMFEGKGQYIDPGKNVYDGQFEGGLFSGEGTMKYTNGDKYEGQWRQGKKHGQGVYTYENEDYYDGNWEKDAAEGEGTSMIDGNFYTGSFSKGRKHGLGQLTTEEGTTIKAVWKNNEIIEKITVDGQVPQ